MFKLHLASFEQQTLKQEQLQPVEMTVQAKTI